MSNPSLTTNERSAIRSLKALDAKDRVIDFARARHLSVIRAGHSLDQTVAIVTGEGINLSRTRINVLTKAYAAAPEGVTADEFVTVYVKAATDENREGAKAKREAAKAAKAEAEGVPQGNGTGADAVRPVTVKDAARILWDLVESFGQDATFRAALTDAAAFVAEPVAA
jgi:hypothetical protein